MGEFQNGLFQLIVADPFVVLFNIIKFALDKVSCALRTSELQVPIYWFLYHIQKDGKVIKGVHVHVG